MRDIRRVYTLYLTLSLDMTYISLCYDFRAIRISKMYVSALCDEVWFDLNCRFDLNAPFDLISRSI